jgi:DNA modification methylase
MASRIEMWPLDRLKPYERNARTHSKDQIEQIAASMIEFGFTVPILVAEDGGILAGHGRLDAARLLGLPEVPVIPLDHLTEVQRRAYVLADNKLAENAGWDDTLLREELEALANENFDLEITGFSAKEIEELLDESGDVMDGETDPDEAPPPPENPISRSGDLWLLGNHRLVVGDCRERVLVTKLMGREKADLILTDPPYNVNYVDSHNVDARKRAGLGSKNREADHDHIESDAQTPEQYREFLDAVLPIHAGALKKDGSFYIFYSMSFQHVWEEALEAAGFEIRCHIIWAKNHFILTYNRYKQQHESVLYCHRKGEVDVWYGDKTQSTVWAEKRPAASREHPTMKPVELLERPIVNSTRRGDKVLDLFGGSGSTMIACERLGRHARMAEISPVYADVILRRWNAFTHKLPVLAETGESLLEVERQRVVGKKKAAASETAAAALI